MSGAGDWRWQAVAWRNAGLSQEETAKRVGRSSRTIRRLDARIQRDGLDVLHVRPARGRRAKLTDLEGKLLEILKETGQLHARPDWRALAEEVRRRWGKTYHPGSLYRVLKPQLSSLLSRAGTFPKDRTHVNLPSEVTAELPCAVEPPADVDVGDRKAEHQYAMSFFDESEALHRKRLEDAKDDPALQAHSLWGIGRNLLAKGYPELAAEYAEKAADRILRNFFAGKPRGEVLLQARSQPAWAKSNHVEILYEAMHLGAKARIFSVNRLGDSGAIESLDKAESSLNDSQMIAYDDPQYGYTNLWLAILASEKRPDAKAAERYVTDVEKGMFRSADGIAHYLRTLGIQLLYLKDNRKKSRGYFEDAANLFAEFPDARGLGLTFRNLARVAPSHREKLPYELASFVVHPQGQAWRYLSKQWKEPDLRIAVADLLANKKGSAHLVHQVMRGLEKGDTARAEERISANLVAIRRGSI